MKKCAIVVLLFASCCGLFSQENTEKQWKGLVRFKPAATVVSIVYLGIPEIVIDWVPYVSPNVGIPVEIDLATYGGALFIGVFSGVEGVVLGNREKNGMFLTVLGGPLLIGDYLLFGGRADIGYQLVTSRGFVFTPAAGFKFDTYSGFSFDIMLDIGFAYGKRALPR